MVEVTAMNHQGKKISVPVANLNITCLPMVMLQIFELHFSVTSHKFSDQCYFTSVCTQVSLGEFELMAPVTLRLKSGSGPVTISGLHLVGKE